MDVPDEPRSYDAAFSSAIPPVFPPQFPLGPAAPARPGAPRAAPAVLAPLTSELARELIEAAVRAPSPDNNQPWRFSVEGGRLLIVLDRRRTLPSDVNGMFDLLGIGAAVENACLAARERGLTPDVEVLKPPASESGAPLQTVARITLRPAGAADPLSAHLADRCTNRRAYSTRPVAAESLDRLAEATDGFPRIEVDFVTDRPRIRALARLTAATDLIRFEYEPFHNELFRQLRFSREEAERTRDGLDVRTLELPPGAAWGLRLLRPWGRMRWLHRLGLGRLLAVPSAVTARRSGALGVLSADEPTAGRFLDGGRALERLWLAAAAEGLGFHPLGSPAIFFGHLEQLGGRKLSPPHQRRISRLIERFRQIVPQTGGRTLLMLFRLGYASPPKCRSLRRPPG